jgi:hypothetical protein
LNKSPWLSPSWSLRGSLKNFVKVSRSLVESGPMILAAGMLVPEKIVEQFFTALAML